VSMGVLTEAVGRFAVRCRGKDAAYIPHASTWLNGERWLDEDERPAGSKVANGNEEHWRNGGGFWGERRG